MRSTQEVITRLLRNIGTRKEVDQYLEQFSGVESKKFAVIKVGGASLAKELDALASSLSFLAQVGLYPIVVHGAGYQLNEALSQAGIHTPRVDGLRVTPPEALEVMRRVFRDENLRLCEALEELGTHARPMLSGVFESEVMDAERLGLVGRVTKVNLESIEASLRAGALPILACLGETPSGQILNINADIAARALALRLQPYKIVFLTETGGLLDDEGNIMSAVNLVEDYDRIMDEEWVHSGMRLKLQEIKHLLDNLPHSSSVSITSSENLTRELFTHRGSGTLIRQGERVRLYEQPEFHSIDTPRLRSLLEDCFGGRMLAPNYFEKKPFYRIYLADSYRATAILTKEPSMAIPYLDKFAVTQEAQGIGVGASIWERMLRDNPRIYWRSRADNPINAWYMDKSDGCYKTEKWSIFWCGLDGFDAIKECVDHALNLPATLKDSLVPPKVAAAS
jgi:bifunctional N-acetylglutamate synthase/kinase